MTWIDDFPSLSPGARANLAALPQLALPKNSALFHPGDAAQGFVIVLSGRIEVMLTGPSGDAASFQYTS